MLNEKILADLKQYVRSSLEIGLFQIDQEVSYNVYESPIQMNKLENYVDDHRKPSFQEVLFQFIDQKGTSDVSVYNKAWMDRRHFSKIRSNPNYRIGKNSVIALALALELSQQEAEKLLHAAGFSLSNSDTTDLVIQFCLKNKIYNLHAVNEALGFLNVKPLTNHG